MAQRTQGSVRACGRLLELLACPIQTPLTQVVWTLLHKAVNHALDYDLRLQEGNAARVLAGQHDAAVQQVARALIGADMGGREAEVLALPGALGGCLLRSAQTCHDQALCSSWLSHEPTCTNFARRLGRPLTVMAGAAAVQAAVARIAATHNVAVDVTAARASLTPAGAAAVDGSPWAGCATVGQDLRCNAMSRVLRLSEQQAAIRIWPRGNRPANSNAAATGQAACGW